MATPDPLDPIALTSLAVSLLALGVALHTVHRGNRNSSVSTLVTLNEAFRGAWQRYIEVPSADKDYAFAELANLLEIACAIHWEKSLFGISRKLSREYIESNILLIENNAEALQRLEKLIHRPNTFEFIKLARRQMRQGMISG